MKSTAVGFGDLNKSLRPRGSKDGMKDRIRTAEPKSSEQVIPPIKTLPSFEKLSYGGRTSSSSVQRFGDYRSRRA